MQHDDVSGKSDNSVHKFSVARPWRGDLKTLNARRPWTYGHGTPMFSIAEDGKHLFIFTFFDLL